MIYSIWCVGKRILRSGFKVQDVGHSRNSIVVGEDFLGMTTGQTPNHFLVGSDYMARKALYRIVEEPTKRRGLGLSSLGSGVAEPEMREDGKNLDTQRGLHPKPSHSARYQKRT